MRITETHLAWGRALHLEFGSLQECEIHEYFVDPLDSGAFEEACDEARQNPCPGLTAEESIQVLQHILDDTGDECPGCAKNAAD